MRLLILTQYYPPELGAPQARLSDLARRFRDRGHKVTVLTAFPNYPGATIFDGYRGHFVTKHEEDGIRVVRSWVLPAKTSGFFRRMMNYLSFAISSILLGMLRTGPQDIIMVESPPLFLGISGLIIGFFKSAKCVFNVSDLWPESAVAMGVVKNSGLIRLATMLEEFIYRHSDAVTCQTEGIRNDILRRLPDKTVGLLTNGVNLDAFTCKWDRRGELEEMRTRMGWNGQFIVGYTGLHGMAQGLECMVEVAHMLSGYDGIRFVFFGDGPVKGSLVKMVSDSGLTNVSFYPAQPRSELQKVLPCLDLALVPLRRLALFRGARPSKMFEAMAAGVPIILSVDGEARELVTQANAGIYAEPENPDAIASAILQMHRDASERERLGRSAREYVATHFDRSKIAVGFERMLHDILGQSPATAPAVRINGIGS